MLKIKHLYVITGIGNTIGKEFMRYYSYNSENYVIGITRSTECNYQFKNSIELQIDLLEQKQFEYILKPVLMNIDMSSIQTCTLIHTAGKAKNELPGTQIIDENNDGIDDEMYNATISTFENIHNYLISYLFHIGLLSKINITIVGIGSLLDKYDSPIHYSMRHIHNMMRNILSDLCRIYENYHTLTLSVSTVASKTEMGYRKYADQTYWLTGSEVVDKAVDSINKWQHIYEDIPIYKKHPLYETYFKYETVEQRIERFKKEIGLH